MSQNKNGSTSKIVVIGAAIIILLGAVYASSYLQTGNGGGNGINFFNTVPSGHTEVAGKVSVTNTGAGATFTYDPLYIRSGSTPTLNILPLSFAASGQIPYSLWEYRSDPADGSTVYAFMIIFGPDNSGNTYFVEISRASPSALTVGYPSGSHSFGAGGNDGYMYFEVTNS
jgi:hypothetical protein